MTRPFILAILFAVSMIAAAPVQAKAKPNKPQQVQKEKLVLMPLRLDAELQNMQGAMETALVEGLQQKYIVISGEQVSKKAREIFMKESKNTAHKECDETRCLQGITEYFQAEILAVANVTKIDGGYLLAISIRNLYDNIDVYSKSLPCKGCDAFQAVEKLKELVGTPATGVSAEPEAPKVADSDPDSALWEEVKKGNAAEDYQAYLTQYPKGKYVALAKAKLNRMKEEARAAAEQEDQKAWADVQQSNSVESYSGYLESYPKGRFAALAQGRVGKLKKEQRREQAAEAEKQKREAGQGPAMVKIPGTNYEMGKYEVTQKEWREVMGSNPSHFSSCGENCPVEQVSWNDIQEFLSKLNQKTGKQYRLPNEEEWQYACYGGSQTEYCGGDDIDAVAWYGENSNETTHPVGQKQANGYGLYDMSGNVWEWMENWYDDNHDLRALRGGPWNLNSLSARVATRYASVPANRLNFLGFRLARTLP